MPGHVLHFQVYVQRLLLNLVNIYAPISNLEQVCFYQRASAFLHLLALHECLVMSRDFNTTCEAQDHIGKQRCRATARILRGILDSHSLVDVCCDQQPDDATSFTFIWVKAAQSCHSYLPIIYISSFNILWSHSSVFQLAPFLDHHLVSLKVPLPPEQFGVTY